MYHMPNRNLVIVVDDDQGMLKCVQRLLREHDYEPILFSSAGKVTPISIEQPASFSTST